jgi:hypothetical protein
VVEGGFVAWILYFIFRVEIDQVDPLLGLGVAVFGVVAWFSTTEAVTPLGLSSLHASPLYLYSALSVPPDRYLSLTGLFGLSRYLDT